MLTELSQEEIQELLSDNYIGRIGCRDGDRIYIFPVNYVYQHGVVYCQSFEGAKVAMMREQPDICFEVEELRDFYHWKTAIGWGSFEELNQDDDIADIRQQLSNIMLAQKAQLNSAPPAESSAPAHGSSTSIVYYRIRFNDITGRSEKS